MASSRSQPGCVQCAACKDNMACGVCISIYEKAEGVFRKVRTAVKREVKRRGAAPQPGTRQTVTALCPRHEWDTELLPGSEFGVTDPLCPKCSQPLTRLKFVRGTLTKTACTDVCKNAKDRDCSCSCGGDNHGANLGKFKFIKKKRRR